MDFLLRIYFIGLVAFVPDSSGQRMTVLLVDARHSYIASDGVQVPAHYPLLFARAKSCSGSCAEQESMLADIVFSDGLSAGERLDNLHAALEGGGGWELDVSELKIVLPDAAQAPTPSFRVVGATEPSETGTGLPLPAGSAPPEDFDYVADLSEMAGRPLVIDPALLEGPEDGRTVGFLRLAAGTVKAQRLSGFKDDIVEFRFATASQLGRGVDLSMPAAALADRVVVEIPVSGCSVVIEERNVVTGGRRSMALAPANCSGGLVEVAIVNLPRHGFQLEGEPHDHQPPATGPLIDRHFELYYELAQCVPPRNRRPVPAYWNGGRVDRPVDPSSEGSSFLRALGLAPGRGVWSQPTCVVGQIPGG